jgi:hypothetical protein
VKTPELVVGRKHRLVQQSARIPAVPTGRTAVEEILPKSEDTKRGIDATLSPAHGTRMNPKPLARITQLFGESSVSARLLPARAMPPTTHAGPAGWLR